MDLPINNKLLEIVCSEEDIAYLGLFGSRVRGEAKTTSDLDVLVDFQQPKSFFQLARTKEKLEKIFNKKVDLVLKTALKQELKTSVMKDLVTIYGQIWFTVPSWYLNCFS